MMLALAFLPNATAGHETTVQEIDVDGDGAADYYVTLHDDFGVTAPGVREETNGCPGMQAHAGDCNGDGVDEPADAIVL